MAHATETVEIEGHIIDSLILAKVMDLVLAAGADYEVQSVHIGKTNRDISRARIQISAPSDEVLGPLLSQLQAHGANRVVQGDAELVAAETDGVLPAGFYATTNLPTWVRVSGRWVSVANPEMDCGIVVRPGRSGQAAVRSVPMHRVRAGDLVVVGTDGVRVEAPERPRGAVPFEFMTSEVSSEKPKAVVVAEVADRVRREKTESGGKVLAVCGPAVIHTGAGPDMARLVRAGWIDILFAGNGFAAHDIEANVMGTSLGVSMRGGTPANGGHANHLRVINEVRRYGSIAAAVEAGYVDGGVMYECVRRGVPFVLAGSLRDDGPLPDVYRDIVEAADAMRYLVPGISVALMLASTLHAIATGNLLPAGVETFCVDINQAVVTKLADRGSHQALGIVTDVGLFVRQLSEQLGRGTRLSELAWGRRLLMCRPEHFTVLYEINPWMHTEVRPDPERAMVQFDGLMAELRAAGAEIELMDPVEHLPDLVFTANAGVVNGRQFVPARFRHPQRQAESAHDATWFAANGFDVTWLPEGIVHEGAGDALPFGTAGEPLVLVSAYRFRSDASSHPALSKLTGAPVRSVELVDERLYHLDLAFCPLDDRRAMVAPLGLDTYGRKVIDALVPELLVLEDDEALSFCANSVVVGSNVIMPSCPPRLGRALEAWGFSVGIAPVDEFLMAGGACRCLTLALDVDLRR